MAGSPMKSALTRQGHRSRPSLALIAGQGIEPPPAPAGLLQVSQKLWTEFWQSDVARAVDRRSDMHALTRWIKAVDEYERTLPALRKVRLVKGSTGQPVLSPLASYVSGLEATISRLERAFGMDPQSRLHLGLTFGQVQLTAARLNQMIDDDDLTVGHDDDEWEPA